MNTFWRGYVRCLWVALWLTRPFRKEGESQPHPPKVARDYQYHAKLRCPNCGHRTLHRMIEWLPERVTTAECNECGFEGTL